MSDLICLLWYKGGVIRQSPVDDYTYMESRKIRAQNASFLLSCPVVRVVGDGDGNSDGDGGSGEIPQAVSLASDNRIRWIFGIYCQVPTNFLGVVKHEPPGMRATLNNDRLCSKTRMFCREQAQLLRCIFSSWR